MTHADAPSPVAACRCAGARAGARVGCAVGPAYQRTGRRDAGGVQGSAATARRGCRPRRPMRSTAATGGSCSAIPSSIALAAQVEVSNQNIAAAVAPMRRRRRW